MKDEIKKIFRGGVEDDEETLMKYSRDASIFEVRPKMVLFPLDSEDVKNLVKWVSENKDKYNLSITPRGAGTDMSGGAIGESLILDFTRHMNKLISFKSSKHAGSAFSSITVQPGMFYRDFEKITLKKGLILPCYTASKNLNTIGGMFGNNSAGERTLKYGQTEDYVLEAKIVLSDGNEYTVKPLSQKELQEKIVRNDFEAEIYKKIYELVNKNREEIKHAKPGVHKNSSGYFIWNVVNEGLHDFRNCALGDKRTGNPHVSENRAVPRFDLNKLLVGSQGTLGIMTEVTLRLVPNPKYSKLVVIFLNDLEPLGRLVDEILKENPETLESYDNKTLKLAVKFFRDFMRNKGIAGMTKFLWNFLPEFKMLVSGGFPKMILLAEFSGENEASVHEKCASLEKRISVFRLKTHITKSEEEAEKYWDIRRESFSLLRHHVKKLHTAPFIDDIIVRPEFLPKFIPELNAILKKYKLIYTIAGHAGDGNFHIIPLMDFSRSDTAEIISELSEKVYDLVLKYHGSITAEHNDGLVRTPYLEKMFGKEICKIFREIKNIFDPQNIFNPGKKVPVPGAAGTKEYLTSHIISEHNVTHRV